MDHPDKRQRAERRDKQGRLARTVDAPAAPDQVRRQPAARNRADVGEQVDGDQRRTDRREATGVARREEFEPLRPSEEIGTPEQEKITEIGRATWRERVCETGSNAVVAVSLKKKKKKK